MRIAILDSGVGGLTVFSEIAAALPNADLFYFGDNAAFPYGRLSEAELIARVCALIERIVNIHAPEMIVLACNTASTLSLPILRAQYPIPFVGTVPAIKPAVAVSQSKYISILATPGTVARDYTRALIAEHASHCHINLVGSAELASYAEAELHGFPVTDEMLYQAIAPAFLDRTDTIVLACTHYPLLIERFKRLAPREIHWIDPAPAIARRVASLGDSEGSASRRLFFTKAETLSDHLKSYGFATIETEALPFLHL